MSTGKFYTHGDTIDLRDVVETARQYLETYSDTDADRDDYDEARAALDALESVASDLGLGAGSTYTELVDAISAYADDEPTAVAVSYFEDYARELADDLGMVSADAPWPARHIDWSAAADELLTDYSEFTLEGEVYYIRSV